MESERNADEQFERSSGCCCKGRCFGGHTTPEAGLSFWVHPYVLAATRFASFIILIIVAIWWSIPDPVDASVSIFVWTLYLEAATFLMLANCSVRAGRGRGAGSLPNIVVPLHQTACALALFNLPLIMFVVPLIWTPLAVLLVLLPLLLFLLDTSMLGARVRFRAVYFWIPLVLMIIATAFQFILLRRILAQLSGSANWILFIIFLLIVTAVWCAVAALIVTGITRLTEKCGRRSDREASNDIETPMESNV